MTTLIEARSPQPQAAETPFDLTVDLFSQMVESGLIPGDTRVLLRDGRLYEKMAKTKAHGYVGAAITKALTRRLPEGWSLWPESTIALDPTNAPLPDFAVIQGSNPLIYAAPARYPGPGDVGILIEIAVTSLREDLTTALEQYARASIPIDWIVDVPGRRILVHADPRVIDGRGTYARVETYRPGQSIPLLLDGQETARVPVDELLVCIELGRLNRPRPLFGCRHRPTRYGVENNPIHPPHRDPVRSFDGLGEGLGRPEVGCRRDSSRFRLRRRANSIVPLFSIRFDLTEPARWPSPTPRPKPPARP